MPIERARRPGAAAERPRRLGSAAQRIQRLTAAALLLLGALGWSAGATAQTVFACGPEWAALTRALLPGARLHVATHAAQDPHHIEARPALISQLRAADAAICTGGGLEAGWLPMLQQRAGNPRVRDGEPGLFLAAQAVTLIDARPDSAGNPFAGDVHGEGNPHLHADPRRVLSVAGAWGQRLQQLFPAQAGDIARRQQAFEAAWRARLGVWSERAASLRGRNVAAQHASFAYLWDWLGMRQRVDLEPRPGLSPTPGHLQGLLSVLRERPVTAIVVGRHQDPRAARWLAQQLGHGVPVLHWPATVEDPLEPDALGRWFDRLVDDLLRSGPSPTPAGSAPAGPR